MAGASKYRIYLSPPHADGNEFRYLKEAFDSNWIAPTGPYLTRFENDFVKLVGGGHAVAVSAGTAALHLALQIAGVGKDDVVLCPSYTFIATISPVVYLGATPVFVDCDKHSTNTAPKQIEEAIETLIREDRKPKAVIVVHLYGYPALMEEIAGLCKHYGIALIEDAAESLGSTLNGKQTGTFGEYGVFSFNGNKIITTSGGGMLWCANKDKADYARNLSTQARQPVPHYEHTELGYNFRLSNLLAAVGVGQLEKLAERVSRRREINERYQKNLGAIKGLSFLKEPAGARSNKWLTTVYFEENQFPDAARIVRERLDETGIEARPTWKPMHMQPVFKNARMFGGDYSKKLFETGLCLPSGSSMSNSDVDEVSHLVTDILGKMRKG